MGGRGGRSGKGRWPFWGSHILRTYLQQKGQGVGGGGGSGGGGGGGGGG